MTEFVVQSEQRSALERLLAIAKQDSGQSRRVADFLLAWWNAAENGGFDPASLWGLDDPIADDVMTTIGLVRESRRYIDSLGYRRDIDQIRRLWRSDETAETGGSQRPWRPARVGPAPDM
jgi:hypothetical protein